jgi:hypothetical protein
LLALSPFGANIEKNIIAHPFSIFLRETLGLAARGRLKPFTLGKENNYDPFKQAAANA